jgi:RND family efflux transporter MFP subunit
MLNLPPPPQHPQLPPPQSHHYLRYISVGIVLIAIVAWGIISRVEASSSLRHRTDKQSIPTVAVMQVPEGPSEEDVVLPGNAQAWHEAPIYARTNGYLKTWTTDIGAHVKTGDELAEIETPEVDAQLHQAQADLATAQANNKLAQSTAIRWQALLKTNSVAKQEADEKTADALAKEALVASAQANLDRLQQLEDFKRVIAPFDGTITARNTDYGALINAGSGGVGQELFHIADVSKLRVYVQVPESYTQAITPDMKADLYFPQYPGRPFPAVLGHTADALDPVTRTLLIELEVDNDKGELMPGGYVETHMKLPSNSGHVHIPVNTLLFRGQGMQAATIDGSGKAQLVSVTIGRDYGKEVEILTGLTPGETIIVNPPDSLLSGQPVNVVTPDQKEKESDKGGDKKTDKDAKDKKDGDNK